MHRNGAISCIFSRAPSFREQHGTRWGSLSPNFAMGLTQAQCFARPWHLNHNLLLLLAPSALAHNHPCTRRRETSVRTPLFACGRSWSQELVGAYPYPVSPPLSFHFLQTEILHSGLRNDDEPETFPLKHRINGIDFPCRYIKIGVCACPRPPPPPARPLSSAPSPSLYFQLAILSQARNETDGRTRSLCLVLCTALIRDFRHVLPFCARPKQAPNAHPAPVDVAALLMTTFAAHQCRHALRRTRSCIVFSIHSAAACVRSELQL